MGSNQVFVLGAGFTRAFMPSSPLLIDDFGSERLLAKFKDSPRASRLLRLELQANNNGQINIERLMTRLDGRMPYDSALGEEEDLAVLLRAVKEAFTQKLVAAKNEPRHDDRLRAFARYCVTQHTHCITFNYDDVLDEALWEVAKVVSDRAPENYWHPDGGYGFFLQNSESCVANLNTYKDQTAMTLIKLHGSINWRVKLGHPRPYVIDAIVHHEEWLPPVVGFQEIRGGDRDTIEMHLEREPFIVPPVLIKSILTEQPILKLTWSLAYKTLQAAEQVFFIGYSLPRTDIASLFLFREALADLPQDRITIVNYSKTDFEKNVVKNTYREIFPALQDEQFDFRDALEWSKELG